MNDAFLGYTDRILSASICRSLAHSNRPYVTLDVRDVLRAGLPSPKQLPAVIVSATALRDYSWMTVHDLDRQLNQYLQAGGHIIWIGGTASPAVCLAAVNAGLTRTPKQTLPTTELLRTDDSLGQTRLILQADSADVGWPFVRPPSLGVGWTQPLSPWRFDMTRPDLQPFLVLNGPDPEVTVGVLWTSGKTGSVQGAYLPVYALASHLLVKSDLIPDCAEPELDAPGMQILAAALDRIKPH